MGGGSQVPFSIGGQEGLLRPRRQQLDTSVTTIDIVSISSHFPISIIFQLGTLYIIFHCIIFLHLNFECGDLLKVFGVTNVYGDTIVFTKAVRNTQEHGDYSLLVKTSCPPHAVRVHLQCTSPVMYVHTPLT